MMLSVLVYQRHDINKDAPVLPNKIGDEQDLQNESKNLDEIPELDFQADKNKVLIGFVSEYRILEGSLLFLLDVGVDHGSELLDAHGLVKFFDSQCLDKPQEFKSLIEGAEHSTER